MKTPAQSATLGKFKARLAHLQVLDAIGPTEQWLDGIPAGKIAHFAGEARMAGVDEGEPARSRHLAFYLALAEEAESRG